MFIIKANGDKEQFSQQKLKDSIIRAGIPQQLQSKVLTHIEEKLYDGIKTSEIYHHITEFLDTSNVPYIGARYGLKYALKQLGPTGYPFEDYVAKIFAHLGFTTTLRVMMKGTCITHEVDVLLEKGQERAMVEVKFHHLPGAKTDVHVALYTKARFEDVKLRNSLHDVYLVTNTKISPDAINFAECVGMKVISWSYPEKGSLRELIEEAKLIPVTALTTLSTTHKQDLLRAHVVLCKEIMEKDALLDSLQMSKEEKQKVLDEIKTLL
jgi:hypothetical protein